jgi:uncharacterized membrane protein YjjP (DUF1212 family)
VLSPAPATDASSAVPLDAVAHIALRIGRLLLVNGADANHAQRRVTEVIGSFGQESYFFISAEALLLTIQDGEKILTKVGPRIPVMGADMGRLVELEHVLDRVRHGSRDIPSLDAELDTVEFKPSGHSVLAVILGVALTAFALARLFSAEWPVAGAAFVAGAFSTLLRFNFARHKWNPIAAAFLTALLSGLAGALLLHRFPHFSPALCLVAAGMILVPGVPLINGVRDVVAGHPGNGIARLSSGVATVLAIGSALFLATFVADAPIEVGAGPQNLPVGQDLIFSALAAAGYAMLFNVPYRALWGCVLCGLAGHGLRTVLEQSGLDITSATLLGATAASLLARLCAYAYRVPPVIFAFPGVVAMVPGSYAFRAGIGGLELMRQGASAPFQLAAETLSLIFTAVLVTVAIAIGLTLALSIPPEKSASPHTS